MKTIISIVLVLVLFAGSGCYYDSEEGLYGVTNCDTTNVTYSVTISGIMNKYNCLSCHAGNAALGGFSLEGYNNVKAKVTDNRLFGAITHANGFAPMPQNANMMSDCDINKVKAWIEAGAPNN
jgi:cytochrome c551/c552